MVPETSRRAFDFALEEARLHDAPLHVMFCWQLKDLGVIPGYENAVAPVKVGQRRAEEILSELMAKARIPRWRQGQHKTPSIFPHPKV